MNRSHKNSELIKYYFKQIHHFDLSQCFSTFWIPPTPPPPQKKKKLSVNWTFFVPPQATHVPPGVRVPQVENCWFKRFRNI